MCQAVSWRSRSELKRQVPAFVRLTAGPQCDRAVRGSAWSGAIRLVGDGGVGSCIRGGHPEEVRLVCSELSGRAEQKWIHYRIPLS